jgi:hypothetical protein
MRIGDTLYFSPEHAFRDLDFTNTDQIALAFQDRVDGFYFAPAARLITSNDAFAAGLVIFAGVEFVAEWGQRLARRQSQNRRYHNREDMGIFPPRLVA